VAITVLDSGSSAVVAAAELTINVTVSAGSGNRKLLVALACEGDIEFSAVTFNGQNLVSLGLEVPDSHGLSDDGLGQGIFWEQFEGGMPAPGTHAITTTVTGGTGGEGRLFYWLIDGARQDQIAEGANAAQGNSGTTQATTSTTISSASADGFLASVFYRNDNATSINLTSPTPTAQTTDLTCSGGGRLRGAHKLEGLTAGSNTVTWTTQASGQQRRALSAVTVQPISGASLTIGTAAFASGAATVSSTASRGRAASVVAFVAGAATVAATASHGLPVPVAAFAAGSATMAVTAESAHPISVAAFTAGPASLSATLLAANTIGTAAFVAGSASLETSATVTGNRSVDSAAFAAGSASLAASVSRGRAVSSASFAAGAATFSAETDITVERLVSVAAFEASAASMSVTASSPRRMLCNHPRPKLNLPGYTPPRLPWQPPTFLPTATVSDLARALTEQFRGVYAVLQQLGQRRAVVPLLEDIDARAGQVIVGVGAGQTILLPEGIDGELGQVSIVLTDVSEPVNVVNPDGTFLTLGQAGAYDFITGTPEVYQTSPGGSVVAGGVPTDRLLGRDSAGTGPVEFIAAGTGLEFSGVGAIRISAAAAGAGLTGGAGSALAVGAGDGIDISADAIAVDVGDLAGAGLENDGSNNLRIASSAAGAGLTGGSGAALAVGAGDGIDVAADSVSVDISDVIDNVTIESSSNNARRAALTGFAAANAGSNQTTSAEPIVTFSASSNMSNERVLSDGTNTTISTAVAGQISVTVDDYPLSGLADQPAETFVGNFTASSAAPTARAGSSVAGAGLTYAAGGTLAVGAGTGVTVNANDVQLSTVTAETFFGNFTASTAAPSARAGSSVAGAGLTYTAGGTLAVGAGTGVTVNANDIAVTTPLSDGDKGHITVSNNGATFTIDAGAVGTVELSATVAGAGLTGGGGTALAVGAGTGITVNANDVEVTTPLTDGGKGHITVSGNGTSWTIDANAVGNVELNDMAEATLKGRDANAGTGNPQDLSGSQVGDIIRFSTIEDGPTSVGTYEPTLNSETTIYRINPNSVDITFTGFAFSGGNTGKVFLLIKQGGDGRCIVQHNSGSTTANGAFTPYEQDFILSGANTCAILWYQSSSSRWNITGAKIADRDYGDITVSDNGDTWTIDTGVAGSGLTGGGGSALAVGAGTHITVNANDVAVNVSTLVPAIDSTSVIASGSVLHRAALTGAVTASQNSNATVFGASASGAGLTGGGTAVLAVGAGTGITVSADAVAVNTATDFTFTGSNSFDGNTAFQGGVFLGSFLRYAGILSVTISSDQNNWSPTGIDEVSVIRVTASGGNRTITGIVPPLHSTVLVIINVGTNLVTLASQSGLSTSTNRFVHNMDSPALAENETVTIWYDNTTQRWRFIAFCGSLNV